MPAVCPACGKEIEGEPEGCACRSGVLPPMESALPAQNPGVPTFAIEHGLQGIGGWLILVLIGLVVSPIQLFRAAWLDAHSLAGPNRDLLNIRIPGLTTLVSIELFANATLFLGILVLIVLFFRESRSFPRLYQAWLGFSFVAKLAEYTFALHLGPQPALPAPDSPVQNMQSTLMFDMLRSAVAASVWIAYFELSRRVKATFVR
jgi:hypothetical protein